MAAPSSKESSLASSAICVQLQGPVPPLLDHPSLSLHPPRHHKQSMQDALASPGTAAINLMLDTCVAP